jgi:hypothetical protein
VVGCLWDDRLRSVRESDQELIRLYRKGDARTRERLQDRHERVIFAIPISYRLSREDAADITQLTHPPYTDSGHADGDRTPRPLAHYRGEVPV